MDGLVRQATSQHGLLTTAQLRLLGFTKAHQANLVRHGVIERVRRGVIRLAGSSPTWEQALLGVCLSQGAPVVASHRSALRIWGLRTRFTGIEVSVRYPKNRRLDGVQVHRSVDLVDDDIVFVGPIPVTSVARAICDSGATFPDREVQRAVDHSVATGLVTAEELLNIRRRVGQHGRNGVVRLQEAIDKLPTGGAGAESGPELKLLRILEDAGMPAPTLQHPLSVGGRSYRIDLSYPSVRLALEYDGVDAHSRVDRFVADRRRQNDLVGAGWTVLRYTHLDLRDRPWVIVGQVARQLADL